MQCHARMYICMHARMYDGKLNRIQNSSELTKKTKTKNILADDKPTFPRGQRESNKMRRESFKKFLGRIFSHGKIAGISRPKIF